jgi:hypothetical protein
MTDIEKARRLFRDAGLSFPAIPRELAPQFKKRGEWLFSTRPLEMSPYHLQYYVREVEQPEVEEYAVLSHSGHGVNSYAIQYYLVRGPLCIFLHLGWGGVYMDAKQTAAQVCDCFSMADKVVAAAQKLGPLRAGRRLTIVGSDFYGSYWLPTGKRLRATDEGRMQRSDLKPLEALAEALAWLKTHQEGIRSEPGSKRSIPGIAALLLPVLRIVADKSGHSVEAIRNRVKERLELSDEEIRRKHPKSGTNVFVNRVAWALAHLVMGKAITQERSGFYRITDRGRAILERNSAELTIKDLH